MGSPVFSVGEPTRLRRDFKTRRTYFIFERSPLSSNHSCARNDVEIIVTGVVVNLSGDSVTINTDMLDPNQRESIDRKLVKSLEPSTISPMPPGMLNMMKEEEILDLVAYILSKGDKDNAMFKK